MVALVNAEGAPLSELAHEALPLHAGEETSVAATKSYIAALAAVAHLAAEWSDALALPPAAERRALAYEKRGEVRISGANRRLLQRRRRRNVRFTAEHPALYRIIRQAEFVSAVSHELRSPLTSISGALDIVLSEYAGRLSEKQRRYAQLARDALTQTRERIYLQRIKERHERVLARYRSLPREP